MKKAVRVAKDVVFDPGFGFAVSGVLMGAFIMATSGPLSLIACLTAAALITGIKITLAANPSFLQKDTAFSRLIRDDRTPLRTLGCTMMLTAGSVLGWSAPDVAAQATGFADVLTKGWTTVILPAVSTAAYGMCNFRFAADISESQKRKRTDGGMARSKPMTALRLLARRPETYVAIASVAAGLISGGLSLLCVPFAAGAVSLSIKNILQDRPPHTGHPNLYWTAMSALLGVTGLIGGNPLLASTFFLDTIYFTRVEHLTTPGGIRQVWADIKTGARKILNGHEKIQARRQTPKIVPVPANETDVALANKNTLKEKFPAARDIKPDLPPAQGPIPKP